MSRFRPQERPGEASAWRVHIPEPRRDGPQDVPPRRPDLCPRQQHTECELAASRIFI